MSENLNNNRNEKQTKVSQEVEIIIKNEEQKLIKKLQEKLGITKESALALSELQTIKNKDDLKKELEKINIDKTKYDENKKLDDIQDILNQIRDLRESIHSKTIVEIASLNKDLIKNLEKQTINQNQGISQKIFSKDFIKKAVNGDVFAGTVVGLVDSTYKISILAKDLGIGIAKLPLDLYKIATGKAETDSFKNM